MPLALRTPSSSGGNGGRSRRRTAAGLAMAVATISALTLAGPAVATDSALGAAAPSAASSSASSAASSGSSGSSPAARAASAAAAVNGAPSADGIIVHFAAKVSSGTVEKAVTAAGGTVKDGAAATGTVQVVAGTRPAASVAAALAASPVVQTVEPNLVRTADAVPNDPGYSSEASYLEAMHLPEAWDRTTGSNNQILAILDSGVDFSHPDLQGRLVQGYDFVNNDSDPSDDFGHGTMVAGIAAAQTNNGRGVAGATWQGTIMPVKVLDSHGSATDFDIAAGIHYAVDHGASVINMSLGGPGASDTLQQAVDYATSHNVVVVAAAGNDGGTADASVPHYPAACHGVIAVAATDASGHLADFSSYGPWVSVLAPGVGIVSTEVPTASNGFSYYGSGDGTSFSSPLVAAVAVLLRSEDPCDSEASIVTRIINSAGGGITASSAGTTAGVVDALAALGSPPATFSTASTSRPGYWVLAGNGTVCNFGGAPYLGDAPVPPGATAVDLASTPSQAGYWIVDNRGDVYGFGDASYLGGLSGGLRAGEQVTSISSTPTGAGYWLFTSAGRVVAFGAAQFYGDMSATQLNGPVLGSVPTPSGHGYYMVASDGGIFAFGDARFVGSMGGRPLNAAVQSLVPNPGGPGYWLVASDGGVFAFGAPFRGSMGGVALNAPVTGMVPYGNGYLMVARDGGVFDFSNLAFSGSLGSSGLSSPVVAVAAKS
jgi:subtilisin family serine protease